MFTIYMLESISNFFLENIGGFFSSGIIAVIGFVIKYFYKNRGTRKSPYTGWWKQSIYEIGDDNCEAEPKKIDYYLLKHSKHKHSENLVINIEGTIRRKEPEEGRTWNVSGYLADDTLTLLYRAHEGQKSRGCIYAKMQSNDDYQGFYLEEHRDGRIDKTPLIIRKINEPEQIRQLRRWNNDAKKKKKKINRIPY